MRDGRHTLMTAENADVQIPWPGDGGLEDSRTESVMKCLECLVNDAKASMQMTMMQLMMLGIP